MTHFPKNFEILFRQFSWSHRFTFCILISRKSSSGKWASFVLLTKRLCKMRFFSAILRPFGRRHQKFARERATWPSLYKISSQSVLICRSYFRKKWFCFTSTIYYCGVFRLTTLCLKKVPTFKFSVTLSNLNRFSQFLHCWKAYEICYKGDTHYPPHLRNVATLPWRMKKSNYLQISSRYGKMQTTCIFIFYPF